MPLPALAVPAVITAGAAVGGSILNSATQGALNRKQQRFAKDMYAVQRRDALDDWFRETSYNSPVEQMKRLRDAGLNPALLYGNGAVAEAPAVRSANPPSWNPRPTEPGRGLEGLASSLALMYDLTLKEAQSNNVQANTDVLEEEKWLKRAQAYSTIAGTGKTDAETKRILQEIAHSDTIFPFQVDAVRAQNAKTIIESGIMLREDERRAIANITSVKEAAARILSMRYQNAKSDAERKEINQRIENLKKDEKLKQLDIDLKNQGVQPHDALWQRKLVELIEGLNTKSWGNLLHEFIGGQNFDVRTKN